MRAALVIGLLALIGGAASGCAARGFIPPTGPGQPFPEFAQQFEDATKTCRGIRTVTGEASLSGRVAGQRVRGRLHLGLAEPNALRLEAVAPFGPPAFVLAAREGEGTLLLPRDNAAVRAAPAADLIDALAGIPLSPDELRAVATGCVAPAASATGGQRHADGITAITLQGGAMAWIQLRDGAPRIVAARRSGLIVEYGEYLNDLPRRIHLRREDARADLTLAFSQIETNTQIEPAAFTVDVPPDARPLTLEELRRAGPLGRPDSES